jgi:hypothetical protein
MPEINKVYIELFNTLTPVEKNEVIDFIKYLKSKQDSEDDEIINKVLLENSEAFKELAK